jgi:hypothetical protein
MVTRGTGDGKPIRNHSRAFMRIARHLRDKGLGVATALALLAAFPTGIAAHHGATLDVKFKQAWDKLPPPPADWIKRLTYSDRGVPIPDLANATLALREAPELRRLLAYDEMERTPVLLRAVPGTVDPAIPHPLRDVDVGAIQEFVQNAALRPRLRLPMARRSG